MTAYPLTLTVEYEENDPDEVDSSWDAPHGFAVICLGRFEVHREPVKEPLNDPRDALERAAAGWLARITGEGGPVSGSVQQEFDDLARRNCWQVDSSSGESVYTRGGETVTLRFRDGGTAVTGASRTVPFNVSAKDWRGQVGNILRHRWRTYEPAGGTLDGEEAAR